VTGVLPLRFVPYHALDGAANVIVDGSATDGTVLTLSHWPGSPTPVDVRDDLSAQIAFRALDHRAYFDGVDAVSNNHFDQDGVASIYALTQPGPALARRELVIDVARAGDFGTFRSRDAARIAFALAAFEDEDRSPLYAGQLDGSYPIICGHLYDAVLPRFTEMLDHPDRSRALWEEEDAHLGESLDAIADGVVRIEERPDIDLAIAIVPDDWAERVATRFTQARHAALHPMALNQSTERMQVLVVQGHRYRFESRYESWVMFMSHAVRPRPDMRDLVPVLDAAETGEATWRADRPGALTPILSLASDADSSLSLPQFRAILDPFLATAPPAWDPFAGAPG
jgi:hypothetical protein